MRVRYVYSACVVIETPDVRILCDPWFTQGAFDGSWFQWPAIERPAAAIGEVDLVYISHIHPDHYDPVFLRHYLAQWPKARIVIGRQTPPLLENKLIADGFAFEFVDQTAVGDTQIAILPNRGRRVNVDTALAVVRHDQCVVNLNDNPFDEALVANISRLCQGARMMALLPYAGATAHPQTYLFASEAELVAATQVKARHFLDIFHQYIDALQPRAVLPFAGKYWLGGPLAALNRYRGMPDAVEAAAEAGERGVVLADGGDAYFDLDTMAASEVRREPYDVAAISQHLATIDFSGYAYERELRPDPDHPFALLPLLNSALRNARLKMPVGESGWICLQPRKQGGFLCFDPAGKDDAFRWAGPAPPEHLTPRLEIYIDDRHLFGLLSRLYHWNNALIGSHYNYHRAPDVFRRDLFDFLDYLQV